jgi:hypothetical protein
VEVIKLNGKPYLTRDEIFYAIEQHVISMEMAHYHEISPAIGDIQPEIADNVAIKLADFQNIFLDHFKKEKYLKAELAIDFAKEKMFDPKSMKVGKFQSAAFGMRINADPDAVIRYVFNVCMEVCASDFRKLGELNR